MNMNFYNSDINYNSINNNNSNINDNNSNNDTISGNDNRRQLLKSLSAQDLSAFQQLRTQQRQGQTVESYEQNKNTNTLQLLLFKQEIQFLNNGNITTNFYSIAQYILHQYFKVNNINTLNSLKLVDLIVDQTFPNSLTLRKLNDTTSNTPYEYFNTISRNVNISKCPIFSLAIYFVIRWSNPNNAITTNNYQSISLLDFNFISMIDFNNDGSNGGSKASNSTANSNPKLSRDESFEPSEDLMYIVFPWLPQLKQDIATIGRSNYKLNSLCELFEFMAKSIIQDLKILISNSTLLPNIVTFVTKFIPDLFVNEQFKNADVLPWNNGIFEKNDSANQDNYQDVSFKRTNQDNYQEVSFKRTNGLLQNEVNDNELSINGKFSITDTEQLEYQFMNLSKRLTTENIRLNQQITILKSEVNSVNLMCNQILEMQKKLLLDKNNNKNIAENNNGINSNNSNGIIILDKNLLNPNMLGTLVQYIEDVQQHDNKAVPFQQSENRNSSYQQQDNPNFYTQSVIPFFSNNTQNLFQNKTVQRNNNFHYQQEVNNNNNNNSSKRRLPFPSNVTQQSSSTLLSPSPSHTLNELGVENSYHSPINKRLRLEDKQTPSQTALDSLLTASIASPKILINPQKVISKPLDNHQRILLTDGARKDTANISSQSVSPNEPMDDSVRIGQINKRIADEALSNNISNPISNVTPGIEVANDLISPRAISDADSNTDDNESGDEENSINTNDELEDETNGNQKATDNMALSNNISIANNEKLKDSSITRPAKHNPNEAIKYKLSRDNKTIWDLYTEWYIGFNGKPSITTLIKNYGWRRWKVHHDSHFFPTRRIIMDYIETECDRGIRLGRFSNPNQPRDDVRKILVGDLEKFRINNGLTLNSLSLFFRKLSKGNKEICIFENFQNWKVKHMTEEEKNKYCKRQHIPNSDNSN